MSKYLLILVLLFLAPVFVCASGYLTSSNIYDSQSCASAYGVWDGTKTISNGACSCPVDREPSGGICDCKYPYYSVNGSCVEIKPGESYSHVTSEQSRIESIKCYAKDVILCDFKGENCVTSSSGRMVSPVVQSDGSLKCPEGFESAEVKTYNDSIGKSSSGSSTSSSSTSAGGSSGYSTTTGYTTTPGKTVSGTLPSITIGQKEITLPKVTGFLSISNPLTASSFNELLQRLLDWILNVALVVAPLIIVYAGFLHVTAMGDIAKITKARNIILYAAIGFIVALMAKSLIALFVDLIPK